ncbi:MAG: ABC transporter substrate-binding protein [Armatimonadota bacterium]|nr:ABC transporter substrate-binding protein [Armatimonadota bacterium]MDR7487007.1 ABC transporter substrate-binding protein [Armatimonadota bacterium]MDR7533415.1 ABC transporter substrate-binding protein [Armatimonadota bacterium]MDR7535217.1 ABC transporter substrate-binding protein [Armatimonadota bacterium]
MRALRWLRRGWPLLAVLLMGSWPAAPGWSQQKDTLVIALPFEVPTPDIHKATGLPILGMLAQIGDSLVVLDEKGNVKPWLAESWTQEDGGRSLVFKIRDNVKLHDGRTVTAEDVVYSLERFRRISIGRSAFAVVESITAQPGNRVKITTRAPFAPLLKTFIYQTITVYSKAAIERAGDDEFSKHPIGPGPYKFVRLVRGDRMELEAFDDYWAGKPKIKRIVVRYVPDISARVAALEAGDVDVIHDFTPQDAERIRSNANLVFINPPSAGFIRFNMNTQRPPFNDVRVRQAMAYAIDRDAIVKQIFRGLARVSRSLVPANAVGYVETYDVYRYNPERARQLLREAGVPDLTFTFSYGAGRYLMDREVVEAVQAQMARAGVTVRINQMEWGQFSAMIRLPLERNPSQMTMTWWRTVNGDADNAIGIYSRAELPPRGNNVPFYSSDEFERLYAAQQVETDPERRRALIRQLQQVLMHDLPSIPMYQQPIFWATRKNVAGFPKKVTSLSTVWPLYDVEFK